MALDDHVVYDVTVARGKYRFRQTGVGEHARREAWRHGQPWPAGVEWLEQNRGSKSFLALMSEHTEMAARLADMEKKEG